MERLFESGGLYLTSGVNDLVAEKKEFAQFITRSLQKHLSGDWGEMCQEDKFANDQATKQGNARIFSAYEHDGLPKIWIITEANRSATTILFPDEY